MFAIGLCLQNLAGLWSLKRRRKKMRDKVRRVKQHHRRRAHVTSSGMRGAKVGAGEAASCASCSSSCVAPAAVLPSFLLPSAAAASSSSLRHSCRSLTTSHTAHTPTTVTHCSLQNTPTLMHIQAANTLAQQGLGAAAAGKKRIRATRKKKAGTALAVGWRMLVKGAAITG